MGLNLNALWVVVSVVLTAIFVAALAPIGLDMLAGVNTTAWTPTQIAIWAIVGVVIIIAIIIAILGVLKGKR